MCETERTYNIGPAVGDRCRTAEAQPDATPSVVAIVEPAPGVSIADASADLARLAALANHWNQLVDEMAEAGGATMLQKGATQLGMLIRFYENASGHFDNRHQPLLALFAALMDRVEGGKPALIFEAPRPATAKTKPNVRFRDLARAHLAAAADVLLAANMKPRAVIAWWGNAAEVKRALRWRDEVSAGKAPPLVAYMFHELRPAVRQPIDLPEAERLARQWRAVVALRGVDP